jgi:hypothetical protein
LWARILDMARRTPGVQSAGLVDALPFSGENFGAAIRTPRDAGRTLDESHFVEGDRVSAEYLQTMGLRLLKGRWFREEEQTNGANTAIVDAAIAQRFFPGEDALGQRICIGCADGQPQVWKQIIGVVNTIRHASLSGPIDPTVYQTAGALHSAQFLVVRTHARKTETVDTLRRGIAAIDANVPIYLGAGMTAFIGDSVADRRFTAAMLSLTAMLALALAAAGVFAVVSYTASERRPEIGVRMALGATGASVYAMVLREGMRLAAAGVAVGLAISAAALAALRGALPGLEGSSLFPIAVAAALAALVTLSACLTPAFRAARVDPWVTLRAE